MRLAARVFRFCLRAHPREFRAHYGDAVGQTFDERLAVARRTSTRFVCFGLVVAECWNVVSTGLSSRWTKRSRRSRSPRRGSRRASFSLLREIRYALRSLSRSRGFAVGALLLLTLGIGVNTAMFSLIDAYLLRSLPFAGADRIVSVRSLRRDAPASLRRSVPEGLDAVVWPSRDDVIEEAVTWDLDVFTLIDGDRPAVVSGAWVSPSYFRALRTEAALGRLFDEADGAAGAAPVAVLGYDLWKRRFGGATDVVGRSLSLYASDRPEEAESFTVVGVLPADFWFVNTYTELFTNLTERQMPYLLRLQEGVSPEQAEAHLTGVVRAQLSGVDPEWPGMSVTSTHAGYVRNVRPVLAALAAAVGLVVLIACGNVALLLSLRALSRSAEIAVRRALGASAWHVAVQLGAEGALLATTGALFGLALAWLILDALAPVIQAQLGLAAPGGSIKIQGAALAVTLGLAALVTGLFALAPAVTVMGRDLSVSLGELGRGASDTRARQLLRNCVIAGEVGLSLALLIGASLMLRTAVHLHRIDLGFEPRAVASAYVSLRQRSYADPGELVSFVHRYLERARAVPGVAAASLVAGVFPFQDRHDASVVAEGGEASEPSRSSFYVVSPDYFKTLAVPVVAGRAFREGDGRDALPVVILSDVLAESLWPGASPLGRRVRLGVEGAEAPLRTVVGLVPDVRESLTGDPVPDVYVPFDQAPSSYMYLLVKLATTGTGGVIPALQRAVSEIDRTAALTRVVTMDEVVGRQRLRPRFLATLLVAFSLFASALAVTGLYYVVAYAVSQRRRDVAIRIALGASDHEVVGMFLRRGVRVTAAGLAAGLLGSLLGARLLSSQLHGVSTVDVMAYTTAAAALSVASVIAIWVPSRRAARTDPLRVLRQE